MMRMNPLIRNCVLVVVAFAFSNSWAFKPQSPPQQQLKSFTKKQNQAPHRFNAFRTLHHEDFTNIKTAVSSKSVQNESYQGISNQILKLLGNDGSSVKVQSKVVDNLGNTHLRLQQYFKEIFVVGADMVVHLDKNGDVYATGGAFTPGIDVDTAKHMSIARIKALSLGNQGIYQASISENPRLVIFMGKLCYDLSVKLTGTTNQLNQEFIDAQTGETLLKLDRIMRGAPGKTGSHTSLSGTRLSGEDGSIVTMQGWHDEPGNYFFYNKDNLWRIYNESVYDWVQNKTNDWGTTDPAAVSLAKNFETVQNYFKTVVGINSFDNAGAYATAHVHVGSSYVNAYWDGKEFYFGDGDGIVANSLTIIDVAAHEYGHAITQYTSNLMYYDESGALNESFSDIMGTMVEFWAEPDGRDSYPKGTPGKADWLCGEDCWLQGDALRDLRDPQRCGQPSYYHGTNWFTGSDDNGGVHYNSGVQNHFFYLLSEGGKGVNDGHSYSVNKIGIDAAGVLALYVDRYLLTSSSGYQETRDAWILAAQTLGYDVKAVADAWSAVGVLPLEKHLAISPSSLNFGKVGIGVSDTVLLQLSNSGAGATMISAIQSDNAVFGIASTLPLIVPGGGNVELKCVCKPINRLLQNGNLTIVSNADDYPSITVTARGEGVLPAVLNVNPSSILVSVNLGDSVTQKVMVKNTGEADLKLTLKTDISRDDPAPRTPLLMKGVAPKSGSYTNKKATGSALIYPTEAELSPRFKAQTTGQNILYVNTMYGYDASFLDGLKKLSNVGKVDVVDGAINTPNVDYLLQYDMVILASSSSWANAQLLGDNLAGYVDLGGRVCVLVAAFAVAPFGVGGRFATSEYMPIIPGGVGDPSNLEVINECPITKDVKTLSTNAPVATTTLQGNSFSFGTYDTKYLIGAYNLDKPVVAINVFPGDGNWSGDLIRMVGNTIDFTGTNWLSCDKAGQQIQIATGDSVVYTVKLNAGKLFGGIYSGTVYLYNNDPSKANPLVIPCEFTVAGERKLSVSPQSLEFGNVWQTTHDTLKISFVNNGTEATRITSVTSNNSVFSIAAVLPLTVKPSQTITIGAVYSPVTIGEATGIITLQSNAMDNPSLNIAVHGNGTVPPAGSVTPPSLQFTFGAHDSPADKTCVLSNTGGDNLAYQIMLKETVKPSQNGSLTKVSKANLRTDLIYNEKNYENTFLLNRVIVRFKDGTSGFSNQTTLSSMGASIARDLAVAKNPKTGIRVWQGGKLSLVNLKTTTREGVLSAIKKLRNDANVLYAEPDYIVHAIGIPNDPDFSKLYGMYNIGQTGGTVDADIDATEAWDNHTGNRRIVLGLIDTGIDYLHPDLVDNIWTNPGEIPGNGIDDDGNGFIDDVHGYDFANNDGDPMDDHFHGTHCAGTIGASGNNGIGVAGVMWNASIMAIKFLDANGSGSTSAAIDAVNYATAMGVSVTSNSWGGGGFDQGLADAIAQGGLFVAAAGNSYSDNDLYPNYPASFDLDNIISVAATDHNDLLADFSCYGKTTVDLGAPGVDIYSCAPNNSYQYLSGTSMATPHVSGTAGLIWSLNPFMTAQQVKKILLESVDKIPSLQGKIVSEGRLNAAKAVQATGPQWLKVTPNIPGIVTPGTTKTFNVNANPTKMVAGHWNADVIFKTNDPQSTDKVVTVSVDVAGCKNLSAQKSSIDFGTVWTDRDTVITVDFVNTCNDWVTVSSFTSNESCFSSITTAPVKVAPFGAITVPLRFAPKVSQKYTGRLTVASDAEDHPSITIDLAGKGILPPIINVTPLSILRKVNAGGFDSAKIVLHNIGEADYYFTSKVKFDLPPKKPIIGRFSTIRFSVSGLGADTAKKNYDSKIKTLTEKKKSSFKTITSGFGSVSDAVLFTAANNVIRQVNPVDGVPFGDSIVVNTNYWISGLAYDGEYLYSSDYLGIVNVIDPIDGRLVRTITTPTTSGVVGLGVTNNTLLLGNVYDATITIVDKITGEFVKSWIANGYGGQLCFSSSRQSVFIMNGMTNSIDECKIDDGSVIKSTPLDFYANRIGFSEGAGLLFCSTWDGVYAIDPETGEKVSSFSLNGYYIDALACDGVGVNTWLTLGTRSGVVPFKDSLSVAVGFTSNKLLSSTYTANALFEHAPGRGVGPKAAVPCSLTVLPYSRLSINPPSLSFSNGWVGYTDTLRMVFVNEGNTATRISNVSIPKGTFACLTSIPLDIPAFDSVVVGVTYSPTKVGKNSATITIKSNAKDNPTLKVSLTGVAVTPPKISLSATSFSRTMMPGKYDYLDVTIKNKGGAAYPFKVQTSGDGSGLSLKDASLFGAQYGVIYKLDPLTGQIVGDTNNSIPTGQYGKGDAMAFDGTYLYYTDITLRQVLVFDPITKARINTIKLPTSGVAGLGVSDKYLIALSSYNNTCYVLNKKTGDIVYQWAFDGYFSGGLTYISKTGTVYIVNRSSNAIDERSLETGVLLRSVPVDIYIYGISYSTAADRLFVASWDQLYVVNPHDGSVVTSYPLNGFFFSAIASDQAVAKQNWLSTTLADGVVPANGICTMHIDMTSNKIPAGSYKGSVDVVPTISKAPGPYSVACNLTVLPYKSLTAKPLILNYGTIPVGSQKTMYMTLENNGSVPTTISSIPITTSVYKLDQTVPLVVEPYQTVQLGVVFAPGAPGIKIGALVIQSDAQNLPTIPAAMWGVAAK